LLVSSDNGCDEGDSSDGDQGKELINTALACLCTIQALIADDVSSSAIDIGRRGGVPLLMRLAQCETLAKGIILKDAHASRTSGDD
jgi:hypothetical protein